MYNVHITNCNKFSKKLTAMYAANSFKSTVLHLVNTDRLAKQLDHVHDFDRIISIFLTDELHKTITLVRLCYPVFWHVNIHCK